MAHKRDAEILQGRQLRQYPPVNFVRAERGRKLFEPEAA